jgi:hypothetical protein
MLDYLFYTFEIRIVPDKSVIIYAVKIKQLHYFLGLNDETYDQLGYNLQTIDTQRYSTP